MVGIVLQGEGATVERQRLLKEGREVSINLRERDARGRKKSSLLQFGMNGSTAWVFCRVQETGMEPRVLLEQVLADEAAALFAGYLERMELRRCLVNPSPLSAALVDISPCIAHMAENLGEVFGINVPLS